MIGLNELIAKKAEFEEAKAWLEAKIAVVDEFIAEEKAKCAEEPTIEEATEETVVEE